MNSRRTPFAYWDAFGRSERTGTTTMCGRFKRSAVPSSADQTYVTAVQNGPLSSMAFSGSTVPGWRPQTLADVAGGIAAVAAGLCWTVKAVAILATGQQPAFLFELAPVLMAFAILVLGWQLPPGKPRTICAVVATAALLAGLAVVTGQVMLLPAIAYGIAMVGANLLILVGLVIAGLSLRRRLGAHLPLVLGLVTFPALLVGGLAAELIGERALEVPLVALGVAWIALGVQLARGRYRSRWNGWVP
jgi:hypothetical protein